MSASYPVNILYTRFAKPLLPDLWQSSLSRLPATLQHKIIRFRRWQDRHAALFAKLLLQQLLIEAGYATNCLDRLRYDAYGRPWLEAAIDFNISHSGEYVVCALASKRIGIDVEAVKPIKLSDFRRYMTLEQWQDIEFGNNPYPRFYEYWTMKEAVMKADGRGLQIPPAEIQIATNAACYEEQHWHLQPIAIAANYPCYLASSHPVTPILQYWQFANTHV